MASVEKGKDGLDDEQSPIEQVQLIVPSGDDVNLPVFTFRMWVLGLVSCIVLSMANTVFHYRAQPFIITAISAQMATLPLGRLMARALPKTTFTLPGFGSREFSLNPGPFNMKEHVLISIFANAGSAFGNGSAYAVGIVNIIKAIYMRKISFLASWILVITTQVLGYGWAGILRKHVVDPAEMWWPGSLVQVSLFRAFHEKDDDSSRGKFFRIASACSSLWYLVSGFFFRTISSLSLLCLAYPRSVTAHQLGSGLIGLGIGSFTLDWSVVASLLGSPLVMPFFAIFNVLVGYVGVVYVLIPIAYWGFNVYGAKTFPLFSSQLFNGQGQIYNLSALVNDKFELDLPEYEKHGRINLSIFSSLSYGLNFAAVMATLTHVAFFNGKEIYQRFRASYKGKEDIHTRLMRKYRDIPSWWFHALLAISMLVSLGLGVFVKDQVQLPWWGLLFSAGLALVFTLPISIITATTNQTPGLILITEYIIGMIYPGRPIANVCFKTYGYISMSQAVSFLNDFKLGHYMKVPPQSMFIIQLIGTIIAGTINISVAWYLLTSIDNICQEQLLPPNSPWTCPNEWAFYDASVKWGVVGPRRIFGSLGNYSALNWCFLGGALAPVLVWALHKLFPKQEWIRLVNMPILLGATAAMPQASSLNFNSWIVIGTTFNLFVYRYRKNWWQKYNYLLSAALDAGVAFMGVVLFLVSWSGVRVKWWGTKGEHCGLASCPTASGLAVDGCPVF